MDLYHIWCDLKPGVRDSDFVAHAERYLGHLRAEGLIRGHRLTRRKLGLGPPQFPEFHLMIEVDDLAQLERAFQTVAARAEPVEGFHHAVNSLVERVSFALYRDFPDPARKSGEEKF